MKLLANMLFSILLLAPMVTLASPQGQVPVEEEIKELQSARLVVLRKLFKELPGSQQVLETATGYAVFFRAGLDLGLVSSRRHAGILRHNRMGRDSYYSVISIDGSEVAPREDVAVVYVFQSSEALDQFEVFGWEPDPRARATVADDTKVKAAALPGTRVYLLSEKGIPLQSVKLIRNERLN